MAKPNAVVRNLPKDVPDLEHGRRVLRNAADEVGRLNVLPGSREPTNSNVEIRNLPPGVPNIEPPKKRNVVDESARKGSHPKWLA